MGNIRIRLIVVFAIFLLFLSFVDNIIMFSFLDSIEERLSSFNFYIFVSLFVFSLVGQIAIYVLISKNLNNFQLRISKYTLNIGVLVVSCIIINFIFLSFLLIQIMNLKPFDVWIFKVTIYLNYFLSMLGLGLLIRHLFSWFLHSRSILMFILLAAFSAYLVNEISGIVYINFQIEKHPEEIRISPARNPTDSTSLLITPFAEFYKISSIVSFGIAWIATCALLYHYSRKIGRWRFWILVSLPLIYYIGTVDLFKNAIFAYVAMPNPYLFPIVTLALGVARQIGGLLFALSLIMISINLDKKSLKYYLMISSAGIMLLLSSNQISLVLLIPNPPFGLITLSQLSMSSFLLLVGLQGLASSMAHDKQLLENVRKLVKEKASSFLYDIGSAQWQKEMDDALPHIMTSTSKIHEDSYVPSSLTAEEIKKYMDEVTDEIKRLREK